MTRTLRTAAVAAIASVGLLAGSPTPIGGAVALAAPASPQLAASPTVARPLRNAPAANAVRVATYNVMKTSRMASRWSWSKRRNALRNTVRAASPDVLAVQEANTQRWNGGTHVEDVRRILAGLGYQIGSRNYTSCTSGCTRGSHIFFKSSRMRLVRLPKSGVRAAGMTGISRIAAKGLGGIQDRNVSWAFLSPRGSSRTTLYVSVHLPTQKTAHGERLRVAVASRLRPWADQLIRRSGLRNVELVIAGDFNSFQRRQPRGAQTVLAQAGLIDGFTAPVKVNAHYGTVNYTPQTNKYQGFPPRPHYYKRNTTRIDYVFSTVRPQRHEVVLHLTGKGTFDNRFRASDHNMVMVDLSLR
ncbi:MAG: endonuclease/exonuclease/phosphatase family protein [Candidatus Nanopelagicales bacterium]